MTMVVQAEGITKIYDMGEVQVAALRGIDLHVAEGEFLAVMGHSGSGKTTLMNILGCLDRPTEGLYRLGGEPVHRLSRNQRAEIRNRMLGFVFQSYNLLPRTTALENVELPLYYTDIGTRERHRRAMQALDRLGLADRAGHYPSQLSGGQQQRVAIARALVNRPSLILADEPTGNLDTRTSIEVMNVIQQLHDQGITVIVITHEKDISEYAQRVVQMKDGRIVRQYTVPVRRQAAQDLARLPERSNDDPA